MRRVLTLASVLGVMGVAETFVLFICADKVFGLNQDVIRTLIYLKLSVSGHLTVFVTRSKGPFWSPPAPAKALLFAVVGTQGIATATAVFGLLMTPLGWQWAAVVWCYALFWFLVEDRVKLMTSRRLDSRVSGGGATRPRNVGSR
jgi:H+-transporting ATPase